MSNDVKTAAAGTGSANREVIAALIAALIGAPLVFLFVLAMRDGSQRATTATMDAIFGHATYEKLAAGEALPLHYLGNDRTAPDFTLPDKSGHLWKLSDHRGKVIVLNFWSITCQPCVEEMPSVIDLADLVADRKDVEVVAVSTDASWQAVSTLFPSKHRVNVLFDPAREVVKGKFGTRLFPETWIIDGDGVIRFRFDGSRDWSSPLVLELIDRYR